MLSDGPRHISPNLRVSPEFCGLVNLCAYAYTSKSILQCTAKLMVRPVMMVVGLRSPPTPVLTGKLLRQKTEKFTILIIMLSRIFMN